MAAKAIGEAKPSAIFSRVTVGMSGSLSGGSGVAGMQAGPIRAVTATKTKIDANFIDVMELCHNPSGVFNIMVLVFVDFRVSPTVRGGLIFG